MICHKTDHLIEECLILPAARYISRLRERSKSHSKEVANEKDNKHKEKDRRSTSKVRFSDKKKSRKDRVYVTREESADLANDYNDVYIGSDNDETTYFMSEEQPYYMFTIS